MERSEPSRARLRGCTDVIFFTLPGEPSRMRLHGKSAKVSRKSAQLWAIACAPERDAPFWWCLSSRIFVMVTKPLIWLRYPFLQVCEPSPARLGGGGDVRNPDNVNPPRAGFLLAGAGAVFGQVAYRLPTDDRKEKSPLSY